MPRQFWRLPQNAGTIPRSTMIQLGRKLRLRDYFALAFGTMIGVGWLVLMDDWLGRGGQLGAMLAFGIGGLLLLPVGYVYGWWGKRLSDAAGGPPYAAEGCPPLFRHFPLCTVL